MSKINPWTAPRPGAAGAGHALRGGVELEHLAHASPTRTRTPVWAARLIEGNEVRKEGTPSWKVGTANLGVEF